ncbi:hypothetical protein ScPMuIL_007064 [Solemya velum]
MIQGMVFALVLLSMTVLVVGTDNPCQNHTGNIEIGCRSYTTCLLGVAVTHECGVGLVYNSQIGRCDQRANVGPPCGGSEDCSHSANKRYPDYSRNCTSYYTCYEHNFLGFNYCPPGLVYHDRMQTCDWPRDTPPPCGNKTTTVL